MTPKPNIAPSSSGLRNTIAPSSPRRRRRQRPSVSGECCSAMSHVSNVFGAGLNGGSEFSDVRMPEV